MLAVQNICHARTLIGLVRVLECLIYIVRSVLTARKKLLGRARYNFSHTSGEFLILTFAVLAAFLGGLVKFFRQ